jgi:hypothetical protein
MRATDFLTEATLVTATTYTSWPNYLNKILAGNISLGDRGEKAQGLELDDQSKNVVRSLIAGHKTAVNQRAYASQIANTALTFTDGTSAKINQIFKSPALKGSTEEAPKIQTRSAGLVAEGLLGVAMYAKLIARGGDLTADVTPEEIWNIVSRIKPEGVDSLVDTVKDINSKVSDSINLTITLAADIQEVLTNPKYRPLFEDKVKSWCKYVNADLSQKYADILYKNNRPDNITIRLAGTEGGKVDVLINVLDKDGTPTRKLEQLKLSVKLSDSLIGQQARGKSHEEVYTNLEKLFDPLGVDLSGKKDKILKAALSSGVQQQFISAMAIAYKEAANQLMRLTKGEKNDVSLSSKIAALTDFHATQNDPEIQVIEQTPGGDYRLLNYKGLKSVFEKNNIDVTIKYVEGTSSKIEGGVMPRIIFYDKNNPGSKGMLVEMRFRARGNYANHIIIPGPLLKELAAFNRFKRSKK